MKRSKEVSGQQASRKVYSRARLVLAAVIGALSPIFLMPTMALKITFGIFFPIFLVSFYRRNILLIEEKLTKSKIKNINKNDPKRERRLLIALLLVTSLTSVGLTHWHPSGPDQVSMSFFRFGLILCVGTIPVIASRILFSNFKSTSAFLKIYFGMVAVLLVLAAVFFYAK
jgi:hypothetical protein